MTEDEAQVALVALGPKLEWRRIGTFWVHDGFEKDEPSYTINEASGDPQLPFRAVCSPETLFAEEEAPEVDNIDNIDRSPCYRTLAEARAACERHCATGQWHSGSESVR